MSEQEIEFIFKYWGKASPDYPGQPKWHPLAYHCLDVAAVASAWWHGSVVIPRVFMASFDRPELDAERLHAWVLFFVALHDLGKFDLRFQLKAPEAIAIAWGEVDGDNHGVAAREVLEFDHGGAGMAWANQEYPSWIGHSDASRETWDRWAPWLAAVTGHHGDFYAPSRIYPPEADESLILHDGTSRKVFVLQLARLFLEPVGLSLRDAPPACTAGTQAWLAGFCSVCDWVGSNISLFPYRKPAPTTFLAIYFGERVAEILGRGWLRDLGLVAAKHEYGGVSALLHEGESPRGVQVRVDDLPLKSGLTLIEAPTGSGKTEAALAYAWRLLAAGTADSVVFALPTQATANAMLVRAEAFAATVFGNANVVLAHGKSQLNSDFERMVDAGQRKTGQGREDAAVQCAAWLASSRKRVFLGQVGVCTVDQTLLSVLPVRHKFVRGFGLNKSVLIVDEVHAYDAYMNGLLCEILRRQKATGGSAILLSATLPARGRAKLFDAWETESGGDAPYPALWHADSVAAEPFRVPREQHPQSRKVEIECVKLFGAFPNEEIVDRIVTAAEAGAFVAVIMNLVDDAQRLARILRDRTMLPVDVFHARYRFTDRQKKERATIDHYGRHAARGGGRILVATQVVEQSLDLDFDWMLTQICPVDLVFQRLGRLHRHERPRPAGFEVPCCTVLSVVGDDYGLHELIYGNTRVLWRTERLLAGAGNICFPEAYRGWIEKVYGKLPWEDEPDGIYGNYLSWWQAQQMREADAIRLTTLTVAQFRDEEGTVTTLTRDGEMSLTVLPVRPDGCLLDGQLVDGIDEHLHVEILDLQCIPVPAGWEKWFAGCRHDDGGRVLLEMVGDGKGEWTAQEGKLRYSEDFGLEIMRGRP